SKGASTATRSGSAAARRCRSAGARSPSSSAGSASTDQRVGAAAPLASRVWRRDNTPQPAAPRTMTEEAVPDGHDHDAPAAAPAVTSEPRPVWPRLAAGVAFALALFASAGVAFLWWQYREFYVALHEADTDLEASLERVRATQ